MLFLKQPKRASLWKIKLLDNKKVRSLIKNWKNRVLLKLKIKKTTRDSSVVERVTFYASKQVQVCEATEAYHVKDVFSEEVNEIFLTRANNTFKVLTRSARLVVVAKVMAEAMTEASYGAKTEEPEVGVSTTTAIACVEIRNITLGVVYAKTSFQVHF